MHFKKMTSKKKPLNKNLRLTLLIILALFFAASVYSIFFFYSQPQEVEKSVPAYSYTQKGGFSYLVFIRPNSLYAEPFLGPGKTYFTKLVDHMDIYLSYQYNADKPALIKGVYNIVAVVEDPDVWRKEFELVPATGFSAEGTTASFRREFPFYLASYQDFLKKLTEEVGAGAKEPKVTIKSNISVEADTAEGKVVESLSPAMSIPLVSGTFKVNDDQPAQKDGSLSQNIMVSNPLKDKLLYAIAVCIVIGISFLLFFCCTQNKTVELDQRKKLIDSIWKKHGERMVMIHDEFLPSGDATIISVDSIDYLIKIADEVNKPVICQTSKQHDEFPTYYVFDGLTTYKHVLGFHSIGILTKSSQSCGEQQYM